MRYRCTARDGSRAAFDSPADVRAWVHVQMSEQDLEWWNGIGLDAAGDDPVAGEWFVFDQNGQPGEVGVTVVLAGENAPDDAVPEGCACPRCGEYHTDALVWLDDETVRCSNCGTTYEP